MLIQRFTGGDCQLASTRWEMKLTFKDVYPPQPSERSPFSDGKTKNPTLDWEQPRTLGVGLVQIPLWKDQTYSSYFKMILTPDYRIRFLSTHRNGPLLTWITWLNILSLRKRWPKFWNWRRNLISNQMLAFKNFKNWKLWGRDLTRSHKSQHFLLNFEVWRQRQSIYYYLILVFW